MYSPKTFDHPSFGPCNLVPDIVAIKWSHPVDRSAIEATLAARSLTLADERPLLAQKAQGDGRDPRAATVNQSETLSWVKAGKNSESDIENLVATGDVEWIAPVYRAAKAVEGPQAYFTSNPKVMLLQQGGRAAAADVTAIDGQALIDATRTSLLKGFVVLTLPNGNALELVDKIKASLGASAATGIKLENYPYIAPVAGCGCGERSPTDNRKASRCRPAAADLIPDDPLFGSQWGLQRINAPRAWPISEGDPNVVVAVLDQGVELAHPDLSLYPVSYSTITHTNDGSPVGNHGTACAGIIGGRLDNAAGISGLAGKCRVMAIATNFADTEVAEGLYYAADNGARVVSMSFGVYASWMVWDFGLISAALQYCDAHNLVLCAATGNEDQAVSRFPATDPTTIGVGGTNRADVRKAVGDTSIEPFWGACYGPDVDVVAPCLEIPTTDRLGAAGYTPTDYDMRFNGTSSATPHVAGLAALVISASPALSNRDVRRIISETTDKINQPAYSYAATPGKPYGTWNNEVGYGRINAERAMLVACTSVQPCGDAGPCSVEVPVPDVCCVSPCDPPWRADDQCMFWYESRFFRAPLRGEGGRTGLAVANYIEFRIDYQHQLCLLGKQHGPLLFTQTLLPGEKVTLYHSERYRRISTETDRFSVQTTFMQFLSAVHQAQTTNSVSTLSDRLGNVKANTSVSVGGGLAGLIGLPSGSTSTQVNVTDHNQLQAGFVADTFNQSVVQSSRLTHAERSVVVSTFEDKETADVTRRTIQNDNECRAVTYFIRKVVELYAMSTRVSAIWYRIVAPNVPPEWHSIGDVGWLPQATQTQIKQLLALLPRVGTVVEQPKPISLPTDGTVYDPELAHCCSCEPERAAAIETRLRKENADALRACYEAQLVELEVQRRRLLLQQGRLEPPSVMLGSAAALPTVTGT